MLEARAASTGPWVVQNLAVLDRALATVGQHLASLLVSGVVPGAEVSIDGHVVGTTPLAAPIRVAAGVVSVEVRAAGYAEVRRSVQLVAATTARESFDLAREPAVTPATYVPPTPAAAPLATPQAEPVTLVARPPTPHVTATAAFPTMRSGSPAPRFFSRCSNARGCPCST